MMSLEQYQHHQRHQEQQHRQHHQQPQFQTISFAGKKAPTTKGTIKGAGGSTSSPKTFQCTGYPGCNMVFTRSEHLARHERKHTGEKPYKCIVANCPRTFSRYDNMIQHTQTHGDRSKRDSLAGPSAVAAAAAATAGGIGGRSRSSSLHSAPLLTGRPRGGSNPVVFYGFGSGYDDGGHHRPFQNSPAVGSPHVNSSGLAPQQSHYRHPYSPHHQQQQQQQYHHTQPHPQYPQQQHAGQWTVPSGTPANSSPTLVNGRGSLYSGDSQPYHPSHGSESTSGQSPSVIKTLKANSRSLPQLQPRFSPSVHQSPMQPHNQASAGSNGISADSPSAALQQGLSGMELEELKRRKSEALLSSSSYPGPRQSRASSQGIGLGMTQPQPLPQVETLTTQEQERLMEHRRSAQAQLTKASSSTGSFDHPIGTPQYHDQQPQSMTGGGRERSGNLGASLSQVHHLSAVEKDRLLEHRKSTPDLIFDSGRSAKRSSNDPTDMMIQPLPSRGSRSGVQWFSQVSAPVMMTLSTPRDTQINPMTLEQGQEPQDGNPSPGTTLPPILGNHGDASARDENDSSSRDTWPRAQVSRIHPFSRPGLLSTGEFAAAANEADGHLQRTDVGHGRAYIDPTMSPRLERHLEERYYPIRKREVLETLDHMETREFLGLKRHVATTYTNEQFRNPEFLSNMTTVLCVIRPLPPSPYLQPSHRKSMDEARRRSGYELGEDAYVTTAGPGTMDLDGDGSGNIESMEVDSEHQNALPMCRQDHDPSSTPGRSVRGLKDEVDSKRTLIHQPCRFALDIDMDGFGRDPEPDLRSIEELTLNSLFPIKSFVAGFEPVLEKRTASRSREFNHMQDQDENQAKGEEDGREQEVVRSTHGYPSNARLGRFYLPERSFRTPESLSVQPDPRGGWVCCQFEEYQGVSVWVLESVLDKYHELARRHKMALTLTSFGLQGPYVSGNSRADLERDHNDEWEIQSGRQYDIKVNDAVLFPEMMQQVWKDMYQRHHRHLPQYQQQHPQHDQHLQQQHQRQQHYYPSQGHQHQQNHWSSQQGGRYGPASYMTNSVATFEEYQKSLQHGDPRRDSYPFRYSHPESYPPSQAQTYPPQVHQRDYSHRSDRPHDSDHSSMLHHREDLSSAPSSSPNSPRPENDEDYAEDSSYQEHYHQHPRHQLQQSSSSSSVASSSSLSVNAVTAAGANMHRRISIAELCNPMQSLATDRHRH
ncbi:hypothetical protein EDD11_008074 [Mortierella claussenii]|nr:hypothetical protein EDD11_008074 [Mortierella claussenii]